MENYGSYLAKMCQMAPLLQNITNYVSMNGMALFLTIAFAENPKWTTPAFIDDWNKA